MISRNIDQSPSYPKHHRWIRWYAVVGGILFFVLFLVYAWMAFVPTGYRDFTQQNRQSIQRVKTRIYAESVQQKSETIDKAAKPTRANAPVQIRERDLFKEINACATELPKNPGFWRRFRAVGVIGWKELTLPASRFKGDGSFASLVSDPELRQEILKAASGISPKDEYPEVSTQDMAKGIDASARVALNKTLDRMEEILLQDSGNTKASTLNPRRDVCYDKFWPLTALTILRADLRQDGAKAGHLLHRALEAMRVTHLSQFPLGESMFWGIPLTESRSQAALLVIGQCANLPGASLSQGRTILDQCLLSSDDLKQFTTAHAIWANSQFNKKPLPLKDNAWHRFMEGIPEKAVANALRPIAASRLEKLTMAWGKPDELGQTKVSALTYLLCMAAMNVEGGSVDNAIHNPSALIMSLAGNNGQTFNQQVQLQRLILATEEWRRSHGSYPTGIRDLIPANLAQSFIESPEIRWAVYRYDPTQFSKTEGTSPITQDRFEERPVFCHFDLDRIKSRGEFKVKIGMPILPLIEPNIEALLR